MRPFVGRRMNVVLWAAACAMSATGWPAFSTAAEVTPRPTATERAAKAAAADPIVLKSWQPTADKTLAPFELTPESTPYKIFGGGAGARFYFDEFLPAVFERTLALDDFDPKCGLAWMFTGPRGGLTVAIKPDRVELTERYYDSQAFNKMIEGNAPRFPEWKPPAIVVPYRGTLQGVTVAVDHKHGLTLLLNGQEATRQPICLDLTRHQLRMDDQQATLRGQMRSPVAQTATVNVDPARRHQAMIGFGGITSPAAYAQLSAEGKRRWWRLLAEYNLLIQREYPNGQRLNEAMDNFDRLADATPHYYGDNFPNGEISNFEYNKRIRQLGGQVWFEFWDFPKWIGDDVDRYTEAMVGYCKASQRQSGAPPEIVGIQNEIVQKPEQWHRMTLALRGKLDEAGFKSVRIHMPDATGVQNGIKCAAAFRQSPEAWKTLDFAATHVYDFQSHFTNPDGYDALLLKWREAIGDKPFLSTEICVNASTWQYPSYRLALSMGQLYHKNLVLTDAQAVVFCWLLLNVEQPSFAWSRMLFTVDPADGFVPASRSHQLRVYGAYSRRIREGMVRVDAATEADDLLVSAFAGDGGKRTLVLLNRSTRPRLAKVIWPGANFDTIETCDPYHANEAGPAPQGDIAIAPGAIVTLSNVPLGKVTWQSMP